MSSDDYIAADDRGYLYGDALFETVRVRPNGSIRWLDAHCARLQSSGEALGFGGDLIEAGLEQLRGLTHQKPGIWRVTVSRAGADPSGHKVPFGGTGAVNLRFRPYRVSQRPALGLARGVYLPNDGLAEHKTTSYLRSVEVRRRAVRQGFDDAIMTSAGGLVGEASCANVIVVRGGRAVTPPIRGVLPGVTRAGVLRLAKERGEAVEVREVNVEELQSADEIVLLSAGVGVLPAASFLERPLDDAWATRVGKWLS